MWKDSYKIGVDLIDEQHKELFDRVDRLLEVIKKDDFSEKRDECSKAINFLKEYVVKHFSEEEAYQESIKYSGLDEHKKLHKDFTDEILKQETKIAESNFDISVLQNFATILTNWLVEHVTVEDQKLAV